MVSVLIVAKPEELAAEDARRRDQRKESYAAVMTGEVCQQCTRKESKPRQDVYLRITCYLIADIYHAAGDGCNTWIAQGGLRASPQGGASAAQRERLRCFFERSAARMAPRCRWYITRASVKVL